MPDNHFFNNSGAKSLKELAEYAGCNIQDQKMADKKILSVSTIKDANGSDITFLSNAKYINDLSESKAGACIISEKHISRAPKNMALLVTENPYAAYARIADLLHPDNDQTGVISQSATVDKSANIGSQTQIEAGVVIGKNVTIGQQCFIGANSVIGDGVVIGDNVTIHEHVCIKYSKLGNNIIIHPGVKIGQDGFGFALDKGVHVKVPQLGRVIIHDNVEIGANTCIDRGAAPDTVIGEGTKIDNLVQIGHNVTTGKGCIIVSQVGIAGSVNMGDYVVFGGKSGATGHINIGDGVQVAAGSGVIKDVSPGEIVGGRPAIPVKEWQRQIAALKKLATKKADRIND